MIFQEFEIRVFLVFSVQLFIVGLYSTLAALIVRRNRNRSTYLIGVFFSLSVFPFILNAVSTVVRLDPISYYVYVFSVYILLFSQSFLILFTVNLLKKEISRPVLGYLTSYNVLSLVLALIPGSLQYSEGTNWTPVWSLEFYILISVLFAGAIIIPQTVLSFKLYKKLKETFLKKNFYKLFIGSFINFVSMLSVAYYNAFPDNEVFRTVWGVITFFMIPSAGILIYLGMRNNLD